MNPYRNPINNSRYTKALFLEESYDDRSTVLYTLKDVDHDGYPSLYRKYLEMGDLTEITFARTYFDGWEHWQMICESSWFKPFISRWRRELELTMRAKALAAVLEVANTPDHKSSYEANKWLLGGYWKDPDTKNKQGRPSKEEIKRQANELFLQKNDTTEDLKRITN